MWRSVFTFNQEVGENGTPHLHIHAFATPSLPVGFREAETTVFDPASVFLSTH